MKPSFSTIYIHFLSMKTPKHPSYQFELGKYSETKRGRSAI